MLISMGAARRGLCVSPCGGRGGRVWVCPWPSGSVSQRFCQHQPLWMRVCLSEGQLQRMSRMCVCECVCVHALLGMFCSLAICPTVWVSLSFFFFGLCWVFTALAFFSRGEQGLLFIAVHGLLLAVASLVVEHGTPELEGSVVVVHRLSYPVACGTFPDQGWNPCPLYWQGDSHPLPHQGSPCLGLYSIFL